jgi:putative ABC transport system permease protein
MRDWISIALQDLRFAARSCARRPGFAALAILTLGLGIGATTAVFSILDAVLLRPLPYRQPDRLAAVWLTSTREASLAKLFATYRDYSEFARHARSFDGVAAATWAKRSPSVLTGHGPARDILTIPASGNFFEMLGVHARLGRVFTRDDEVRGCSLVLAHPFWSTTLGADPAIVGKPLIIDQKPCTVLGVMPAEFSFYPRQTQAWILLGPGFQDAQDAMLVGIFARLRAGVTPEQAQAELRGLYRALHPVGETRDFQPVVYDLQGEFTFLAGRTLRRTLMIMFGAVLLVMLIGCLNVANLLMARLSERRRELAVRAALGSGQGRLVRQVLTESLLLSTFGAATGIAIAWAGCAISATRIPSNCAWAPRSNCNSACSPSAPRFPSPPRSSPDSCLRSAPPASTRPAS